jgi:copper chaperone CopZ
VRGDLHQITLTLRGMNGGCCVREVRDALGRIAGVDVESVTNATATLSYDAALVARSEIIAALEHVGYAQ